MQLKKFKNELKKENFTFIDAHNYIAIILINPPASEASKGGSKFN